MSTRIKGSALKFTLDGDDYWADATSVVLENEEAADAATTFADAQAGGARTYYFTVSAIQSTDTDSLWRYIWANTGEEIAYTYAPHGNATASSSQPHFTGTVRIPAKPTVGGEAGLTNEYTFEVRFDCLEEPTLVTGA